MSIAPSIHKLLPTTTQVQKDRDLLSQWYTENKRILPWRSSRNPYRIWISEVMLQQTTVVAVVPFYEKFLNKFPDVKSLAQASLEEVYEYWAGLGYYSRARNLHKAAQQFALNGFPSTASELIEYPGLGPYTSRAIASLAFNERVGVLDGNVIRVLSRRYGLKIKWWETPNKELLQKISDQLADCDHNADINQGLMELGATVCTPKKTLCLMCPWKKSCVALKQDQIKELPLARPKKQFEIWHWDFDVNIKNNKIYLIENQQAPFLKNNWLPPSKAEKLNQKPKQYLFKHGVTKYEIYVTAKIKTPKNTQQSHSRNNQGQWVAIKDVSKINPTSLIKKIIQKLELD